MKILSEFCERIEMRKVIKNLSHTGNKFSIEMILSKYRAYRMDGGRGKSDMRDYLGLGSCETCDYFFVSDDSIVLIEDTQIMETEKNVKEKFSYLKKDDAEKFFREKVRQEVTVKVYGSLVMLRELAARNKKLAEILQDKKSVFWFVLVNVAEKNARGVHRMEMKLLSDLRSKLKGQVISDIKILTDTHLDAAIQESIGTTSRIQKNHCRKIGGCLIPSDEPCRCTNRRFPNLVSALWRRLKSV